MNFRKTASVLHLWLGLISGLVVFISLIAASGYVWQEELSNWIYHGRVYVPAVGKKELPLDSLLFNAQKAEKGEVFGNALKDRDPRKAVVFSAFKPNAHPSWYYQSATEYNEQVYVDQYTGKVLGVIDLRHDIIANLYPLHVCLLLNYDFAHYIVGGATLIIFVMAFTGIVLWWPKNKAALRQRLWFRWKNTTRWKRKNYDLHNIGGIYTLIFILIFAITGLTWTFDWWTNGIYRLLGNDPAKIFQEAPKVKQHHTGTSVSYEHIAQNTAERIKNWQSIMVTMKSGKADSAEAISGIVRYNTGSGWDEWDEYIYNSQTGDMYFSLTQSQKLLGEKWRTSNYAIHTGSIYGLPTKILATFVSLFCAFLPVSGFLIWYGRNNKKRKTTTSLRVKT